MTLFVCLDDKYGMAFNGRRQSQDRLLRTRMLEHVGETRLWMRKYSAAQFFEQSKEIVVCDQLLDNVPSTDACFIETDDPMRFLDACGKVVIYRWNRVYPADLHFPQSELERNWVCVARNEFRGSSHEKITEEIYEVK